jgi:hypothetical protein
MSAFHLRSAQRRTNDFELESHILPTGRQPRADPQLQTSSSLASSHPTATDENERRDDRVEIVAIVISFLLMISGLAIIVAAVLLSRPSLRVSEWLISQAC